MSPEIPEQERSEAAKTRAHLRTQRELGRYAGLGLQFAASVGLLAFGGYWLDGRLGTLPLFLLIGAFLGFAGSTVAIVRAVQPVSTERTTRSGPPPR